MITNQDIMDTGEASRAEIQRGLGRIEGKLDALVNTLSDHTKDDHYNFERLNAIVETIQKSMYKALGVVSFLAISIPVAIAYFKH